MIKKENAESAYVFFVMKRYKESLKAENDYLKIEDLNKSCELIDYAYKINPNALPAFQKEMNKIERNLDAQLYQPFLKQQNYGDWKHIIDLFGCMVYLELYITKKYGIKNNYIAISEYEKICKNFETDLTKYSEIYRAVKKIGEDGTSD